MNDENSLYDEAISKIIKLIHELPFITKVKVYENLCHQSASFLAYVYILNGEEKDNVIGHLQGILTEGVDHGTLQTVDFLNKKIREDQDE